MSNSSPAVRFAICGVGHIGRRHAALVARHAGAGLAALIDVRAELQPELAAEFPGVPFFASLEEYLTAVSPDSPAAADVLTVATPNYLHAPQAILGLRAGLHVVVEKPIALRKRDAEDIIHVALQTGRLVFGVMQNRYSPPSQWLKELVDSGRLGQTYLVQINCFWNRDARYYRGGPSWKGRRDQDGGTLFTQFSHFVDLLYWVFGDIENIRARFFDFNHATLTDFEDSGLVSFDLVRGGAGTLQYSTSVWDRNLESSLTVVAERGSLRIAGQYMDKVEYCHVEGYQLPELAPTNPANDYGPYQGSAANHVQVIENVVDTVQKRGFATTNALEGMKVVEMIERIYNMKPD
ncbi:Gfo/Idh/MocA family oxidoreductase [Hymenobacter busanensis]|uniref:Gfo/Idh/MocA family oxidoreductase n=1 Tax=Hymenobacter busanensis TaxID=2607656 RepID=A0A7L4ZX46_9BACT|nr:Gfo/Idh/MocA family oxidoreductase [Hymenobacter busanensis]KAA9339450.1 Gfo/Idh/MocA family oxidoreductase [Hymenobacter busanensis]QHJ06792.1 Gfo/Idh/MocA family oxidoreductase [Hymenobacter busanensis]